MNCNNSIATPTLLKSHNSPCLHPQQFPLQAACRENCPTLNFPSFLHGIPYFWRLASRNRYWYLPWIWSCHWFLPHCSMHFGLITASHIHLIRERKVTEKKVQYTARHISEMEADTTTTIQRQHDNECSNNIIRVAHTITIVTNDKLPWLPTHLMSSQWWA